MVEILALVLHHDEEAVLTAVAMALAAGVPTKTHILNLLHRLLDGKPVTTPPVTAPPALRLVSEPMANVERYDALRGRPAMRQDRKGTRLNSRPYCASRMPSSA